MSNGEILHWNDSSLPKNVWDNILMMVFLSNYTQVLCFQKPATWVQILWSFDLVKFDMIGIANESDFESCNH